MAIDEIDTTDPVDLINHKLSRMSIERPMELPDGQLPVLKHHILSSNPHEPECQHALFLLRRYLTEDIEVIDRVQDVIDLGILERLYALLAGGYGLQDIQAEIVWIITNIAAGRPEHTRCVIDVGFLPLLVDCLNSQQTSLHLKTQAAWALSNISDDSADIRRCLLTSGAITAIANLLIGIHDAHYERASQMAMAGQELLLIADNEVCSSFKTLTWTLACMLRGGFNTRDYWTSYLPAFEALSKSVLFDYKEVWIDGCWGIVHILQNVHATSLFYEHVVCSPLFRSRLLLLLRELDSKRVLVSALRVVSNISIETTDVVLRFLDSSILTPLGRLISVDQPQFIRRDALLCLSNLAVGQSEIFERLLSDHDTLLDVTRNLRIPWHDLTPYTKAAWIPIRTFSPRKAADERQEWKITNESLWIITNILETGMDGHIRYFLFHHPKLPEDLFNMLRYNVTLMPLYVSDNLMNTMIRLLKRTDALHRESNPIRTMWIQNDLADLLEPVKESDEFKLVEQYWRLMSLVYDDMLGNNNNNQQAGVATATTTMAAKANENDNKRRILRTADDGDIRFIEQAASRLNISS